MIYIRVDDVDDDDVEDEEEAVEEVVEEEEEEEEVKEIKKRKHGQRKGGRMAKRSRGEQVVRFNRSYSKS